MDIKVCLAASFSQKRHVRPNKRANQLTNQMANHLPEIRSGTENKMLETNCPDEKTEPVRCQ
jgi:hypothetical protein